MDILRENIGLLLLEGADHTKLLKKIEAKYGFNINPIVYGTHIDKVDYDDEHYKKNRILARLAMLHGKNLQAMSKYPMTAYANEKLQDLRIERFWDKGKVKLENPSFDVRDRKNSERNFNLIRAKQMAQSAGQKVEKIDGGKRIITTTYDPIHNKRKIKIKDVMDPPKPDKTQRFKRPGHLATLGLIGAGVGIGGGLYALRKRLKNKNKPFFRRLFNR